MANLSQYVATSGTGIGEYVENVLTADANSHPVSTDVNGFLLCGNVYKKTDYPELYSQIGNINASKFYDFANSSSASGDRTKALIYALGYYVAGFKTNSAKLSYSVDGITWTENNTTITGETVAECVDIATDGTTIGLAYNVGLLGNTSFKYSTNGTTWLTKAGYRNIRNLIYSNTWNKFIADYLDTSITTTTNFVSFTDYQNVSSQNITALYDNNGVVLIGTSGGNVYRSTAEGSWSSSITVKNSVQINGFYYVNNKFFAYGNSGMLCVSEDNGLTWTDISLNAIIDLYGMVFNNNQYVVVGDQAYCAVSSDHINWTEYSSGYTKKINFIYDNSGVLLLGIDDTYGKIIVSDNINDFYSTAYDATNDFYIPSRNLDNLVISGWPDGTSGASYNSYIKAK